MINWSAFFWTNLGLCGIFFAHDGNVTDEFESFSLCWKRTGCKGQYEATVTVMHHLFNNNN